MLGAGVQSAGVSPAGVGEPEAAPLVPSGPTGCRYINPATGDYQINGATGHFAQMPPVRQRVLIALLTELGSSTVLPDLGTMRPRKMGDRFEAEMTGAVHAALRQLTEVEQLIVVNFVAIERGMGGRARVTVDYEDLTTSQSERVGVTV